MIDVTVLVREYLLGQSEVTALLGTNANGSIYAAYDLPEHFDPSKGPAIQIYRTGGKSHTEITSLVDARIMVRAWADVEKYSVASALYAAINDVLHGATRITLADGTILRALEVNGPIELTDPDTAWVAMYAFYAVLAAPNSTGASPATPGFTAGAGAPSEIQNNGDVFYDADSGNLYEQVLSSWIFIGNIAPGGGGSGLPSLNYHKVAASSTNAANIKNGSGLVMGWEIFNDTEYPIYVKLYDKATTPNPASDTPKQTIGIQAGQSRGDFIAGGLTYTTGIGIAITKGLADNDNTPVVAGDGVVDIFYQ